jgi:DNA modification methylase
VSLTYDDGAVTLHIGDALTVLRTLPAESVQTCVTSPPYWGLRDYGVAGQLGLEATPEAYVTALVGVFAEVRRVLRDDGTLWLNLGDSYASDVKGSGGTGKSTLCMDGRPEEGRQRTVLVAQLTQQMSPRRFSHGLKPKDLVGIPWRVAFALQADGWYLRSDIIWAKPNPMPESVTDRPTKAHEYLFLLAKSERYYYDAEAIKEAQAEDTADRYRYEFKDRYADVADAKGWRGKFGGANGVALRSGRNKRSVWTVTTQPFAEAHFATFPPDLIKPCILAGAPARGVVLDPFAGAGTTLYVAKELNRKAIGIELNQAYAAMTTERLRQEVLPL